MMACKHSRFTWSSYIEPIKIETKILPMQRGFKLASIFSWGILIHACSVIVYITIEVRVWVPNFTKKIKEYPNPLLY